MPSYENLTCEDHGTVRVVRLNRPAKKNAFDVALATDLWKAIEEFDADPNARVLVVGANGDMFSAGADVTIFLTIASGKDPGEVWRVAQLYVPLRACKKPVIAAVHGRAVGMGVTMLPHFDLVYASEDATFQTPFVKIGLVVEYGGSYTLPRLIGRQRANELLMSGAPLDASWASTAGLVNRVLPREGFFERVLELATALAANPPGAVAETKRLVNEGLASATFAECTAREDLVLSTRYGSPENAEAVMAFFASRTKK